MRSCDLALAHGQDHRHLGQAVLADLVVDLLVAQVGLGAQAARPQRRHRLLGIVVRLRDDRRHHHLPRRQPEREAPGVVLDQEADEALEDAEDRPVQHHRPVPRPVLADVGGVEPLGQHVVELEGAALPGAADGVGQVELELRAVEGALAGGVVEGEAVGVERLGQRRLGAVPGGVVAGALVGPGGELVGDLGHAHVAVDPGEEVEEAPRLVEDLVLAAEDVRVVLGHLPHAHQAVQRAVRLVAVAAAELGHPERQVAVGLRALLEDLDVAGAVHRLQRHEVGLAGQDRRVLVGAGDLVGDDEHVLAELAPVAGLHPERAVEELRRLHLDVAVGVELAADVGLEDAPEREAVRVPEDRALRLLLQVEEVHLLGRARRWSRLAASSSWWR